MIDAHLHVVPPNIPGVGPLSLVLEQSAEVVALALRAQMLAAGVHTALAMGSWNSAPDDPLGVRRTLEIADGVPGLKAVGVCDPLRGDDLEHLRRAEAELALGRVAALKCYLGYLHYEPAHARYRRYYELAAQFGLPVVFHTGDTYSVKAKVKYAHPLGVDDVAVDHPEVQFVLAHLGNPWTVDAAEVIYKNPNVWADLSGLVVGQEIAPKTEAEADALADIRTRVKCAFRYAERPDKFVFGTDWPLIPFVAYRDFIRGIVPEQHHDAVFEGNARRLFRV